MSEAELENVDEPKARRRSERGAVASDASEPEPVATGIEGLDDVLGGGFTPSRSTLSRACPAPARRRSRCSSCWKACGAESRSST